ncbi:hypothetical protein AYJ54_29000 [Bradyrhizobium centrolobii]|uniref:Uncharacterized protein n=1 Tax=Bradyrhizobium centrolobii TaxID=1505087 RepID=A0A176YBJ2_9BRAD|nr:hypothetical protein [Bradyrhizobium centrolobii]OAF01137.1 hypothetical protein AYJ54_29000 [Bradyrhizobium centrolobii]
MNDGPCPARAFWGLRHPPSAAYLDEVKRLKPTGELPLEDFPVLVRFRDPNDPTSVELVDPSNLAASFGPV